MPIKVPKPQPQDKEADYEHLQKNHSAVRELQEIVEQLENRIAALEALMEDLP